MKYIKNAMYIFIVLIAVTTIFACLQVFLKWKWPKENISIAGIIMTIMLLVFAVITVLGMVGQKFNAKKIGFYLLHIGMVVFLVGSLVYSIFGEYANVSVPVSSSATFSSIEKENGDKIDLGFEFGVTNFKVEKHDPVYDIYQIKGDKTKILRQDIGVNSQGYFDFGKYGKIHADELMSGGQMQETINLASNIKAFVRMPVKHYEGTVKFYKKNDYTGKAKKIEVNYPLRYKGWKIYLMSYNQSTNMVSLAFKFDPGEFLSTTAILLMCIGAVHCCIIYQLINRSKFEKQQQLEINKPKVKRGKIYKSTPHKKGGK